MYNLNENYICSRYEAGSSIKSIASELDVSPKPITRILKKNKVKIRHSKYSLDYNYFSNLNSEDKAYILGLLFSDGNVCSSNGSYTVKLTLKKEDEHILRQINTLISSNRHIYDNGKYSTLQVTNKAFFESLKRLSVVEGKTFKITFPDFIPKEFVWDFIRGYFDGDGYFYHDKKRKKGVWAICCNREFGKGLYDYLEACGLSPVLCENVNHKNTIEIRINRASDLRVLYNNMYSRSSFFLIRKNKKMESFIHFIDKKKASKNRNIAEITKMHKQQLSNRKISRMLRVSRYTVDKVIRNLKKNDFCF